MLESQYQKRLIDKLRVMFPGCYILKNDSSYLQGIPDLVIFFEDRWAFLEVKAYKGAPVQTNQPFHVDALDRMSFARFIYPENEEAVLHDLQQAFTAC